MHTSAWGEIMPELRKDYILNRYVNLATERAKRPSITFASLFANEKCPFSRAFSQAGDGT